MPLRRAGRKLSWVAVVLVVAALLVGLGRLAIYSPALAVVLACGLFACVLAATDALALAAFAVVGVWVVERVGAGVVDISGSDTLLTLGSIFVLPYVPWSNSNVRRVITAIVAFEAVLFVGVLVHPTGRGVFEWTHRFFLTAGGVAIGAALAHHGRARAALRGFLLVAAGVGAVAFVASAATGFTHAEVLHYQKNFAGNLMVMALLLLLLAPRSCGFSTHELNFLRVVCGLGVLAFQSRGAILALMVGVVVAGARSRAIRRRLAPFLLVLVPLGVFAFVSLDSQIQRQQVTGSSSITERDRYRDQGLEAWRAAPMLGQGMRFFQDGEFALDSDPHNVVVGSLSETGVVGLIALLALLGTTVTVTWRLRTGLAVAATAALVARFTHGLFDVYWVAGTQMLPWVIVGMALAQRPEDVDDIGGPAAPLSAETSAGAGAGAGAGPGAGAGAGG